MQAIIIITLLIILILLLWSNTAKYKGKSGEKIVANYLDAIQGEKRLIHNVILEENGKTRQIDHIAITEHGVFVIETKNYAGSIYGKEFSDEWKQYLNQKIFTLFNPIRQNAAHTKLVKTIVEQETKQVYAIVVFTRRCTLKVQTVTPVLYDIQVASYINHMPMVLSGEQIEKIEKLLLKYKITDPQWVKNHTKSVQQKNEQRQQKIQQRKCPACDGDLKVRFGKNGYFFRM